MACFVLDGGRVAADIVSGIRWGAVDLTAWEMVAAGLKAG